MNTKIISIVLTIIFVCIVFKPNNCYSQSSPVKTRPPGPLPIQSPEMSSLFNFTAPSLNLYRGQASVSIPIYNIKLKEQAIPISLQYTASGVKPNQQPGWLGSNWALSAGGSIQLDVKGTADYNTNYTPIDETQLDWMDRYFDDSSFDNRMRPYLDLTKDQYSFNFSGYNGKIYFDRTNEIFCSNPELKVEVGDGALLGESTADEGVGIMFGYNNTIFKITAKDGTMYFFGGKYQDKVKYATGFPSPVAWHLFKIITPSNEHVNFDYTLNESTNSNIVIGMNSYFTQFDNVGSSTVNFSQCNTILNGSLYNVLSNTTVGGYQSGYSIAIDKSWFGKNKTATSISLNDPHLFLIPNESNEYQTTTPVESRIGYYTLKSITTAYQVVEFNKGDQFFGVLDPLYSSYFVDNTTQTDRFQQPTLGNIKIYDKINNPINPFKIFELEYNSFALTKVQESDGNNKLEPYTFDYYYPGIAYELICITSAIDHWGYYNASDRFSIFNSSLLPVYNNSFSQREPLEIVLQKTKQSNETDASIDLLKQQYLMAGTLQKVTYPTKGYTMFEYEQNDFSSMVYRTRKVNAPSEVVDLSDGNTPAGGIKVTKITDVASSGISTTKEYKYIKDYLKISGGIGANNYTINTEKKSSGICSANVNYYMQFLNSIDYKTDFVGSSRSCMNGDNIGYSEVAEIINGSYVTINKYSNYITNPDVNSKRTASYTTTSGGVLSPICGRLVMYNDTVYKQSSQESHEQERGKLVNARKFRTNQTQYSIVEEKDFEYGYNNEVVDKISMDVLETNVTHIMSDKFTLGGTSYISGKAIFTEDWADTYQYEGSGPYETFLDNEGNEIHVPVYDHSSYVMLDKKKYIFGDYVNNKEITKTYGSKNTSDYTEITNDFKYSKYSQVYEQEFHINDDISKIITNTYNDGGISSNPDDYWKNNMLNKHMIGIPYLSQNVKYFYSTASEFINSEEKTEFGKTNCLGFPLPSVSYEFRTPDGTRGSGSTEPVTVFDQYSSDGNLLQFHKTNDIDYSFIWSEGKTIGGGSVENDFNQNSSTDGMFGNADNMIISHFANDNHQSYLQLDSNPLQYNQGYFCIPTYFKTADQPSKFTFSIYYKCYKDQSPVSFSIMLGYSDQSMGDIVKTQPANGNATYDRPFMNYSSPPESYDVICSLDTDTPWTKIEKEITIAENNLCNKYVYFLITFNNNSAKDFSRIYLDDLIFTQEYDPNTGGTPMNSNGKYLLAKVENAKHENISYSISEQGEIKLNDINVSTPNSLITKYIYDPILGIKSIIDPNGKATKYEYDTFGRLKFIKDDQGNIMKKFDYHYSGQN